MKIEKTHSFARSECKKRLQELCRYWKVKYGIEDVWTGDNATVSGSILGFSFEASLEIDDNQIVVVGPPPNILVRGRVIGYIEHKLTQYLDPDTSLSDLAEARTGRA